MRILFIADIMGRSGRKIFRQALPGLNRDEGPFDFIIVNGENAAGGFGLTEKIMEELFSLGADCLTSGNHIWDKKEFIPVLMEEDRVLRPANYPEACPGTGVKTLVKGGRTLTVISLQGRTFMPPIDCPFQVADRLLEEVPGRAIFIDFHAEATSEKKALAEYLDGRVSAVVGTHTHVQTADEGILSRGTAFITDVGMTGGHGGIIGVTKESVLSRFLTGMPSKFEISEDDVRLNGVVVDVDDETGLSLDIRRIHLKQQELE